MKYLVIVPDGCGDWPIVSLGGKTPLEAADIKAIDGLACRGEVGSVKTIPAGMTPGSDTANLSLMGYDPSVYLTGRASLEAVGMGVALARHEAAFRTNLVTLEGDGPYEELMIKDHSAGDISPKEAEALIQSVEEELGDSQIRFYPGVGYRCLMVADGLSPVCVLTAPHDALNQQVGPSMPQGEDGERLGRLMRRSYDLLRYHPINRERVLRGLNPANSIWFWGQGTKPELPSFASKYGLRGSVITAVNLIKGIACCAELVSLDVPGANGALNTNYAGKAASAAEAFEQGREYVYVHIEAPDECSHCGDLEGKIKALELIDARIVSPLANYLESTGEPYRILIVTDHYTPLQIRTHSAEPAPFILFDSQRKRLPDGRKVFSEAAGAGGLFFDSGCALADYFIG